MDSENYANTYDYTHEQTNDKKQWTMAKQAPKKYHEESVTFALKQKRQQRLAKIEEQAQENTEQLKEQAMATEKQIYHHEKLAAKAQARIEYAKRHANDKPKSCLMGSLDVNLNQRIKLYFKNHSCTHGLKHNIIYKQGENYQVSCNHAIITKHRKSSKSCNNCGSLGCTIYETQCKCKYLLCPRCKASTYVYDIVDLEGKETFSYQFYDKHSASQTQSITIITPGHERTKVIDKDFPREEIIAPDLEQHLENTMHENTMLPSSRTSFYNSLKNSRRKPRSYASLLKTKKLSEKPIDHSVLDSIIDSLTPKDEVDKQVEQEISKLTLNSSDIKYEGGKASKPTPKATEKKLLDSDEEGEEMDDLSNAKFKKEDNKSEQVSTVKRIFNKIKQTIVDKKNEFINAQIFKQIKDNHYVKEILSFFDTLIYALKVFYDYLDVTTLVLFTDIIHNYITGNKYIATAKVVNLLWILKNNEQQSAIKYQTLYLMQGHHDPEVFMSNDFGCLTSVVREHLKTIMQGRIGYRGWTKDPLKPEALLPFMFINKYMGGSTGVFDEFTIHKNMKNLAKLSAGSVSYQSDGIFTLITSFFEAFPSKFGKGIKMASEFCKIILPTLLLVKGVKDVAKIIKDSFNSFIDWWTNTSSDPLQWLNAKMYTVGNPINDLHTCYILYRSKLYERDDTLTPEAIKAKYYQLKVAAETYATDQKQYSHHFTSLLAKHAAGLAETGLPQDRPFEPTVLALQGAAGAGKSTLWPLLVALPLGLESKEDPIKEVKRTTHTWDEGSEYMTGMANKRCILFDDFGQDKTKNTDGLNLIRLVTSAAFSINSANIVGPEIKGMFATPEIVVVCTNDTNYNSANLQSKEAVMRRLDFIIELNQKLDLTKLNEPQINVISCSMFPEYNKKAITILEARDIFTIIDYKKKQNFKALKTDLNDVIKASLTDMKIALNTRAEKPVPGKHDPRSENFQKACDEYLEFRKQKDVVPLGPVETAKIDRAFARLNDAVNQMTTKDNKVVLDNSLIAPQSADALYATLFEIIQKTFIYGITAATSLSVAGAWLEWSTNTSPATAPTFMRLKHFLWKTLKAVVITAGACGTLAIVSTLFSRQESGTTKTSKPSILPLKVVPQSGDLTEFIKRSCGQLEMEKSRIRVNCLFLGDRYILTVKHFFHDKSFEMIPDKTRIIIRKSTWNREDVFEFEKSRIIYLKQAPNLVDGSQIREDIILYKLNEKQFNAEKNIISHFWNGEYCLDNHPVSKIDLITCGNGTHFSVDSGTVTKDKVYSMHTDGKQSFYHEMAMATYKNRDTACGSPVISMEGQSKIYGIHMAVCYLGGSLFHFVTKDVLEEAIKTSEMITLEEPVVQYEMGTADILPSQSILEYIGKIKPVHQNTKTDLRPSTIFELFGPHTTEPAPLSPNDSRIKDRMLDKMMFYKELFKGYSQTPTFPNDVFDEATEYLITKHKQWHAKSKVPLKFLSIEEALNGLPIEGNSRIDLTTSAGYPYVTEHLKRTDLINQAEDGTLTPTQRIVNDVNDFWDKIKQQIVPCVPFILSIKDERIKLSKIYQEIKPRLFAAGSLLHLIISRQLFYSHIMMHYHEKTYSSVRLDRLSLDWHDFFTDLLIKGHFGFDADFKFWDRSLCKALVTASYKVSLNPHEKHLTTNYGPKSVDTLKEFFTSPYYIFLDKLLRAIGTSPSGGLMTFQLNGNANEILTITGFIEVTKRISPAISTIKIYERHTGGKRGGDDSVQAVSDSLKPIFNGVTFTEWTNSHGMTATSADKANVIVPYKKLNELTFLKNTTGTMNGLYVPLSDQTALIESMYWIRINKHQMDEHAATLDNINCSMRAFYFYGKEHYNKIRSKIVEATNYPVATFEENHRIWKKYGYFPGSHSDYVTKEDQNPFGIVIPDKRYPISPEEQLNMQLVNMKYQSGLDKATLDTNLKHPQVGIPDAEIDSAPTTTNPELSTEVTDKNRLEKLGTTVQEHQQAIVSTPLTGTQKFSSLNKRAEAHCNDINWTLQRLEQKYTLIDTLEWTITNQPNSLLKSYNLPTDILVTAALKTPFDVTAFWRAKSVDMKVVVKAPEYYGGSLVCGFYPSFQSLDTTSIITSVDAATIIQLGGKNLIAADDQSIETKIPFRFPFGFVEAPNDVLGQFCIFVLNPLRTGTANPNSVSVTVFAAIDTSEFKIPEYVPETEYKSHKFDAEYQVINDTRIPLSIKYQSGINDSNTQQNYIPTGQVSVNDPIMDMKPVMLCAGKGIVSEPKIKQFQDHPTDFVQLTKRYKYLNRTTWTTIKADSKYGIAIDTQDWLSTAIGKYQTFYGLYRGSITLKLRPIISIKTQPTDQNFRKQVKMFATLQQSPTLLTEAQKTYFLGGFSNFSTDEPLSIMIPYMSPLFVSTFYLDPLAKAFRERKWLHIYVDNSNIKDDIEFAFDGFVAAADDMAMGVFLGTSSGYLAPIPNRALEKAQEKKPLPNQSVTSAKRIIVPINYQSGLPHYQIILDELYKKYEGDYLKYSKEDTELRDYAWEERDNDFKPWPNNIPRPIGFDPSTNTITYTGGTKEQVKALKGINLAELKQLIIDRKVQPGIFSYFVRSPDRKPVKAIISSSNGNYRVSDAQLKRAIQYVTIKIKYDVELTSDEQLFSTRFMLSKPTIVEIKYQAGIMEFIDKAIDTTLPIANVVDAIGNLLDAHPVTYQPYPIHTKELGYLVATDNIQYLERPLTTNHNGMNLSDKETFGGNRKETDIYELMTTVRSLYTSLEWRTTDPQGALLASWPVGPAFERTKYKVSPPMDVISQDFCFWNGSVKYIIEVVASAAHKGQLTLSFHPNLEKPPANLKQATQQYFTSFDLIKGRATIAAQLPYLKKSQYLPIISTAPNPYEDMNTSGYSGLVCLWVQNELRAFTGVSDTVDINVYKVAGEDYKVEVYGNDLELSNITK